MTPEDHDIPAFRHPAPERDGVEGLLLLLQAEQTLLPEAPDNASQLIQHRTTDEVHACLKCGQQARVAYVVRTPTGNRWLDLCPRCARWLQAGALALEAEQEMNEGHPDRA